MTSSLEHLAGGDGLAPNPTARRHALVLALGAAALAAPATMAQPQLVAARQRQSPGARRFPDVTLQTQDGKPVRFYSDLIRNRVVVFNMTYTTCNNRCPPMTRNLLDVQRLLGARLGREVFMYSLSVYPEADQPRDLKAYMQQSQVGPGWTFLTGRPDDIDRARRSLGFNDRNPEIDRDRTQHTGMLRIGNDALDRWCTAPALAEPELIVEAVMAVDPAGRAERDAARRAGQRSTTGERAPPARAAT